MSLVKKAVQELTRMCRNTRIFKKILHQSVFWKLLRIDKNFCILLLNQLKMPR